MGLRLRGRAVTPEEVAAMALRARNSFEITKASFRVLRGNPRLLVLPLLSVGAVLVLLATFLVPLLVYAGSGHSQQTAHWLSAAARWVQDLQRTHHTLTNAAGLVATFIAYYVLYFIAIFFNTALTRAALEELRGRRATVGGSLRFAVSRLGLTLRYTLVASTVGFVLGQIESRSRLLGKLVTSVLGIAWTLVTFLAIPVMVQEGSGGIATVKRSARLFKDTWGEALLGQVGLGLLWIPALLLPVAVMGGLGYLMGSFNLPHPELMLLAAGIWMVFFVFAVALGMSTLRTIYHAALYTFAAEGVVPQAFDVPALRSTWHVR
jgi:hypothetical protein